MTIGITVVLATFGGCGILNLPVIVEFFAWVGVMDVLVVTAEVIDTVVHSPDTTVRVFSYTNSVP